ncbi:MAG TPA: hypothetical protein VLE97_01845 [Gaiellaceae bacterium]|nr:hypothetical protein [Gaiellaceae bacterium]
MALQVSNGFKERFAIFFKETFDGGEIRVFSGAQPDTSDLAETGTLLGTVRQLDGSVLILTASGPYIVKDILADWLLTAVATGTMGWFRYVADPADAGGLSYNALRFDGAVGLPGSGAELQVDSTALVSAQSKSIDNFLYTLPPIVGP